MRTISALFLLMVIGAGVTFFAMRSPYFKKTPELATTLDQQHKSAHKVKFQDKIDPDNHGHCSGTAVGSHSILTAAHCVVNSNQIYLDGSSDPTTIFYEIVDGNDHVIYVTDHQFPTFSTISQRPLVENEWVHMWGNPLDANDIARSGCYKGSKSEDDFTDVQEFILPVYPGDSGAGVFDESGKIVAVVTMSHGAEEGSFQLSFTPSQIKAIQ